MNTFASVEERHEAGLQAMMHGDESNNPDLWDEGANQLVDAPPNIVGEAVQIRRPGPSSAASLRLTQRGLTCTLEMRHSAQEAERKGQPDRAAQLVNESERLYELLRRAVDNTESGPLFMDMLPGQEPADAISGSPSP